jgi:hypothetical protein
MEHHIFKAEHNQKFHDCIEAEFDGHFYDWKITVLFYVAIHYLKALAILRGIEIGETHIEIEKSVNPDRNTAKMRLTRNAWREYRNLFNYSRTARYEGISDFATFEQLKKLDHAYCVQHLDNFKKYMGSQGLAV